jgi:pyruvate dehydrogenase E2 component (dihydrolipoamide acetyltransferase)
MTDILMPKLSDSMEQGTIISWFKATGDQVEVGDELLEIETDKSTSSCVAELAGALEILAAVGTTVAVGEPIARIGSAVPSAGNPRLAAPAALEAPVTDVASREQRPGNGGANTEVRTAALPSSGSNGAGGAVTDGPTVTPLARRVAAAHRVVLENVHGTGPLGRITRADVLKAAGIEAPVPSSPPQAPQPPTPAPASQPTSSQAPAAPGSKRQELSRLQQLVVRRMAESKSTIPHFQVQTDVDMGAALAFRQELKTVAGEAGAAPSVNDLIVKATAIALRDHPLANGSYKDGAFELHEAINIGVAVAAGGALVVPVIHSADIKSLGEIATDTRRLAMAVRDQTILPPDLSGGTFTVSNLGMFGMTAITPVINPPEAAILGVGATRSTLARVDGAIVDRSLLTLTLSCDHRILYGADAARFLSEIRDLLEAPLRLAL